MSGHLSPSMLNGLADGELSAEQLAVANEHLAGCPACTSNALYQSLLKSATAKAGQRYTPPAHLEERLTRLASSQLEAPGTGRRYPQQWRFGWGWAAAAVLLLVSASTMLVQRTTRKTELASAEHASLVTEVFDQHVATLAASLPPQVVSTDRHTVKPWFQGPPAGGPVALQHRQASGFCFCPGETRGSGCE
jgi:anti-sigma factor RsiW